MASTADASPPTPPPPFFIQTFSEQIERAYLRYRARSTLQRQYRQLQQGVDPHSLPPLGRKRVRRSEEGASGPSGPPSAEEEVATSNGMVNGSHGSDISTPLPERIPPHIDDVYRLDLSVAKPDAGILAVGDPPNDVYLPPSIATTTSASNPREPLENRQIIQILLDKTWESDTLFYDLDGLTHDQIKKLAEVEWSRELPAPPPFYASFPSGGSASNKPDPMAMQATKRQQQQQMAELKNKRKQSAAMIDDEKDLDEEVEYIKRSFCDKSRAHALAARGAAAW